MAQPANDRSPLLTRPEQRVQSIEEGIYTKNLSSYRVSKRVVIISLLVSLASAVGIIIADKSDKIGFWAKFGITLGGGFLCLGGLTTALVGSIGLCDNKTVRKIEKFIKDGKGDELKQNMREKNFIEFASYIEREGITEDDLREYQYLTPDQTSLFRDLWYLIPSSLVRFGAASVLRQEFIDRINATWRSQVPAQN